MFRTQATNRRRGAAVVEFAIVAPVFFLVVLGIVEFGRLAMVQQVITNAAREGARVAVFDDSTTAKVQSRVQDYLNNGTVRGATVQVSPNPPSSAGFGEAVSVTVSVPFDQVSWLPAPFLLGNKTLQAEVAMRRETVE